MALNADQLATLRAIIDTGSFDEAAAELGISASAVSQRIRALENDIGSILVHRTTPALATETGEKLVQLARQFHLLESEFLNDLSDGHIMSELPVAVNADSLSTWFRAVITDAAGWGWGLRLRLTDEAHTLSLLRQGDVLGAVTTMAKPVSGCEVRELGVVEYIPMASPRLVAKNLSRTTHEGSQAGAGDLDWSLPMLRFEQRDRLQDHYIQRFGTSPRLVSYIPTNEGFLDAAIAGLGWAMFPASQARRAQKKGQLVDLRQYVPTGFDPYCATHLYWQCWKLQSEPLQILTESIIAAADEGLLPSSSAKAQTTIQSYEQ